MIGSFTTDARQAQPAHSTTRNMISRRWLPQHGLQNMVSGKTWLRHPGAGATLWQQRHEAGAGSADHVPDTIFREFETKHPLRAPLL